MPDQPDPKAAAVQKQIDQLESEKRQILERQERQAARLAVIEVQLKALKK